MTFTWRIRCIDDSGTYQVVRDDGTVYATCSKRDYADRIAVALNNLEAQTNKGL